MPDNFSPIKELHRLLAIQRRWTTEWHSHASTTEETQLLELIRLNHEKNFQIWHREDIVRRKDIPLYCIVEEKRQIDEANQKRNDLIELIDQHILLAGPEFSESIPVHSESLGMIIDRLSILCLKEFHMQIEADRMSAPLAFRNANACKCGQIQSQQSLLSECMTSLFFEFMQGKKRPFDAFAHKMYNDPSLNPQIYSVIP